MKTLKYILIAFIAVMVQQVSAQGQEQMQFQNDLRIASDGGLANQTQQMIEKAWYADKNGDPGAVLRIKVENMPVDEMEKLEFRGANSVKRMVGKGEHQVYVSVIANEKNQYLEAHHPIFLQSSRLRLDDIKAGKLYDVTLVNNKTTPISINLKTTTSGTVNFYIDDKLRKSAQLMNGETNVTIENMTYGQHSLLISCGGTQLEKRDIEVADGNTNFPVDARKTQTLSITSAPEGAAIYVDDVFIGKAPQTYTAVLGLHKFRAELNSEQKDEIYFNVTQGSTTVELKPVKKSNVIISTKYAGRPAPATLVVDNETSYYKEENRFVLPYGSHTFRVNYLGRTKEKTININKPETSYTFKLSAKNDFVWPWQREYEDKPVGFSIGYVSKQISAENSGTRLRLDPSYWRENKWLPGIQMGFHFQPCFSWGGGFYTGLFYELYFSSSDTYAGGQIDKDAYGHFNEHSLNIPLHLYYRMPFSKKFSVAIHGGIGMDIGLYAFYSGSFLAMSDDSDSDVMSDYYGEDYGGPKRVNFTADIGLQINIGHLGINASYSKGLTNHSAIIDWSEGEGKTRMNKFAFSLSWLFGGDD